MTNFKTTKIKTGDRVRISRCALGLESDVKVLGTVVSVLETTGFLSLVRVKTDAGEEHTIYAHYLDLIPPPDPLSDPTSFQGGDLVDPLDALRRGADKVFYVRGQTNRQGQTFAEAEQYAIGLGRQTAIFRRVADISPTVPAVPPFITTPV